MNLKGKAKVGTLYRFGDMCFVSSNNRDATRKDVVKVCDQPVVEYRWMEDEEGRQQLISQNMGYFITDKGSELKPNQEKIADLGRKIVVQYVRGQSSYKDDELDGPYLKFDEKGNDTCSIQRSFGFIMRPWSYRI